MGDWTDQLTALRAARIRERPAMTSTVSPEVIERDLLLRQLDRAAKRGQGARLTPEEVVRVLAALSPDNAGDEVTEKMIEAARKAVRYQLPEVEARRIYTAMRSARGKGIST